MGRLVILCATQRGLTALKTIAEGALAEKISVVSYPEYLGEPLFLEDIRRFSKEKGFEFSTWADIKSRGWDALAASGFDLLIAVAWRYMVPESFYARARLGAFVFHDSLLPKYRGFSPSVWALINGESHTGMTLFRMSRKVDSGEIVGQVPIRIEEKDDIGTLRSKGTEAMVSLLNAHLTSLIDGTAESRPQDESEATYTCKWIPEDARIDWNKSSREIHNLIRGTTRPYPGAYCRLGDDKLTVWRSELLTSPNRYVSRVPGRLVEMDERGVVVMTGDSVLRLVEVSLNGAPALSAAQALRSYSITLC